MCSHEHACSCTIHKYTHREYWGWYYLSCFILSTKFLWGKVSLRTWRCPVASKSHLPAFSLPTCWGYWNLSLCFVFCMDLGIYDQVLMWAQQLLLPTEPLLQPMLVCYLLRLWSNSFKKCFYLCLLSYRSHPKVLALAGLGMGWTANVLFIFIAILTGLFLHGD